MKRILLLTTVLISLNCLGQRYRILTTGDTLRLYYSSKEVIKGINELYDEYKEKCKNDTIFCIVDVNPQSSCKCMSLCKAEYELSELIKINDRASNYFIRESSPHCYKIVYVYSIGRVESFPDFMEWLKLKYE